MESNFSVTLSTNASYKPVEVFTQRVFKGSTEHLVKWCLSEDKRLTNTANSLKTSRDGLCQEYTVWMREEEMSACCPQLLSMEIVRPSPGETKLTEEPSHEEEPLTEMKDDINNLISRAKRLSTLPSSGKMLSNTLNILSAYANIGALANTFRESGALDLLLTLLATKDSTAHKSAGNMLRSLTTFDLSSRAYVLLHLSKIDSSQLTSVQGRQMLLDLFSETASSGESEALLRGITLPQVPGRYVFSLLKKYLRVNSMTANSQSRDFDPSTSNSKPSEFEKFFALDQLVSELFTFFGWFEGSIDREGNEPVKTMKGVSIFAGTLPVEEKPAKEKKNPYKSRDHFLSDREYGRYVKTVLQPGMKVRARETYESVSMGDFGVYLQTNDGTPPAQVTWEGLGDAYWVYWHQVDLLPSEDEKKPADSSEPGAPSSSKADKSRPYVMRTLAPPSGWSQQGPQRSTEKVERPFWWEVLCLLKFHAVELVGEVMVTLGDKNLKRFEDLINYSPDYGQVAKVLELLESTHPHLSHEPLTIREKTQFREIYTNETDKIPAATGEINLDEELEGNFRKEAPFPDPYHEEEHGHVPAYIELENHPLGGLMTLRGRREFPDAIMQLRFLEHSQDGTMKKLLSTKVTIEKVLAKAPKNCQIALQSIKVVKSACDMLQSDGERQEMCVNGILSFVLKLMLISPRSFSLQMTGIECIFKLVGGYGVALEYVHLDKSLKEAVPQIVSSGTRSVIVTMLVSLSAVSDEPGLKAFVTGMKCVVDYFHTHMPRTQLRTSLSTVCGGLITLTLVLGEKDVVARFQEWGVPELLKAVFTDLPSFPGKRDLVAKISSSLPGSEIRSLLESSKDQDDEVTTTTREVISVVKTLRHVGDIKGKNPLVKLICLFNSNTPFCKAKYFDLTPVFVSLFLRHHGVYYLCQALEVNTNDQFVEHALSIICSLMEFSEDAAAEVVLQGGLRAIVNILSSYSSDRQKHTVCLRALERLSKDPDHLAVMAAENIITPLKNAKLLFQDDTVGETISRLTDLCESEESSRAALHQKILRIIFSGVLQLFLAAIEDARREAEPVNLPRFSAFIKYLSAGSGGAVSALQEQWWEALEVSSNSQHKENLVDDNPSTSWESTGRSGTHWIRFHMKQGLIIKKMYMGVTSESPNFMPQRVSVHGGPTADNAQEISNVYIPATFNGSYEIVTNAKKFYAVVIVRIKRCQLGGVDCRIHGIKCQATTTSLWPLFGDIFSARSKLFYQIQLQTWLRSNLGPLELFDKLSAVILYEQMFGDSFLHTAQSRQCIGQACRSALVTPLIETLTKPNSGGPDLGELIHDYMAQMQAPLASQWRALAASLYGGRSLDKGRVSDMDILSQDSSVDPLKLQKAQKRLVKMSQIRRICRLLVEWDDTSSKKPPPPPVEEDDPPPKPQRGFYMGGARYGIDEIAEAADKAREEREEEERRVVIGSGTIALAKCWGSIVERQVSLVLKMFSLESPYQVAAELLNVYDQLKQAMLELFGGHSQFVLSLKEGFSRAFQGLDEVTGVRLCELLCLCVDSLLDVAGKDSARLHHMGESQREKMLLHFAEPIQFLHGLDLAHIFEHYYIQQLSSRVIRGRSISILLEKRLAATFAHCFPRKSPLAMLEDLDSSQTLMDRFCDSELLESLDQLMLQASQHTALPPEIIQLSQKCSLYRERVFQVYTLNPCFWPVRPRPLPISHLPSTLAQFCEDFTKFFSSVHECGLQHHERPRRLQFTLQGWAVVVYGGIKLVLSTVQMCVLMQFIASNTHTVPSLQEATQLPYPDICEALLSLTSERQAVLIITTASTNQAETTPTVTPSADDELLSAIQSTPFKVSTVFKVNEGFSKDVHNKHKSNRVRIYDVRLVTRGQCPTPSRTDRAVDLAHVFERRRAVMDSAIVRILKKEKQMSVDNIAHKVIKGCSAGRFDRGASFGRFDSDYRDICSRVDHLIVSGYIKRDMANRQMLVYLPDPSTAQDEAKSQKPEDVPTDKLKDTKSTRVTVEPSVSTTKAAAVPTSTTSKPSKKRTGSGRQPQSKAKRKQISHTRLYANEFYEQHEAPLLGMLPTLRSLKPAEVQSKINSLLNSLSQVLKLSVEKLEHLLHDFQWNTDKLMQQYLNDSTAILEGAGLSGHALGSPPPRRKMIICPVCTLSVSSHDLIWLWCNHGCCQTCWQNHLLTQIDLNRALRCSCPVFDCPARPTRSFFVKVFGEDTDPMNKFGKTVVQSYVERSSWLTWCRNPQGCTQVLCRGDGMDTGACHVCKWTSCFSCTFIESHQPATCENIQKWVEIGGFYVGMDEDSKSKQLANIIAKMCPSCSAHIEKNEGCLHMKCKCGHDFCWKCMKPWKATHTDYFNCSAKLSKSAKDHKKFQDFNDLCTSHHRSKCFAEKLCVIVKGMSASVPIKTLSFISDACELLVQCHKMLLYTCVAEFFSKMDTSGYLGFLSESLEGDTNVLQAFLENTLLSTITDVARTLNTLSERRLQDGYRLVSKIENTRDKLLVGAQQQFKLGEITELGISDEEEEEESIVHGDERSSYLYDDSYDDEDDFDDDDDMYDYSDYEDSYHDAFETWDHGIDYDDMFPFSRY